MQHSCAGTALIVVLYRLAYDSSPRSVIHQTVTISSVDISDITPARFRAPATAQRNELRQPYIWGRCANWAD